MAPIPETGGADTSPALRVELLGTTDPLAVLCLFATFPSKGVAGTPRPGRRGVGATRELAALELVLEFVEAERTEELSDVDIFRARCWKKTGESEALVSQMSSCPLLALHDYSPCCQPRQVSLQLPKFPEASDHRT